MQEFQPIEVVHEEPEVSHYANMKQRYCIQSSHYSPDKESMADPFELSEAKLLTSQRSQDRTDFLEERLENLKV